MLPLETVEAKRSRKEEDKDEEKKKDNGTAASSASAASCSDFTQPLFVPLIAQSRVPGATDALNPVPGMYPRNGSFNGQPRNPRGEFADVAHGIAPEFDGRANDPDTGQPGFPCADWNDFKTGSSSGDTHEKEYKLITEETTHQFFPGALVPVPPTPVFVYRDAFNPSDSGRTPGPTFVVRYREPVVVRNENHLTENRDQEGSEDVNTTDHDHETSIHLHGTHCPAHCDGYPDFYVLAGEARDYYYPNIAPRETPDFAETETDPKKKAAPVCRDVDNPDVDNFDKTWIPSTLWYHDHAMDVTGFNVSRGLAGFYLVFDDREIGLIKDSVLPPPGREALESLGVSDWDINGLLGYSDENDAGFDFGLALQDQQFDSDGNIIYDFFDHNGRIGNTFTVNGTVQPFLNVKKTKYRFRILNASSARIYQLGLSSGDPFIVFGADSWLFPIAGIVQDFELAMGQRHDVIIDFSGYETGDEVCLENFMQQDDGRKGDDVDRQNPTHLLKFKVVGGDAPMASITNDTLIRGFAPGAMHRFRPQNTPDDPEGWAPILKNEIVRTRAIEFDRSHGAWTVDGDFFNPRRADAVPMLGTAERWFIENGGGGWWHPIHTHLEGFQIQKLDGRKPPFERSFNSDLANLHGGEEAKVYIKFRTFTGPFVFHCHNIEHEDMRMMGVHDPQPVGSRSPLNSVKRIDPEVSGVVPTCLELEEGGFIFFDVKGDVDRLEGRGVGFPHCEFEKD